MSTPFQLSLLRRTFTVLAVAAVVLAVPDALAQGKVKLSGGSKNDECSYSSMSITPDGSVTVQCSGTTQTPSAESFSMSVSTLNASPLTTPSVAVLRSNSTGAAITVWIAYSGTGCVLNGNTYPLAFGGTQNAFQFEAPVGLGGTCTINIVTPPSPAVVGTPGSTTITVGTGGGGGGGGGTVPAGCPASPGNMLSATFAGLGNPLLQMQASGQIVAIQLPNVQSSGQVTFGESAGGAYTPQPVTLEVSINKCPGVIETDYTNRCNIRSTNGNYNSITWLAKAYQGRGGTIDATTASAYGLCWGGDSGAYYINARWSYSSCAFGAQVCGFAIQYNLGGY